MHNWKPILLLLGVLAVTGCSGSSGTLAPVNPAGPAVSSQLSISSTSLDFGNTAIGVTTTQDVTIRNTGVRDVVVTQQAVTGGPFSTAGIGSNLTLTAGQSATLSVNFQPTAPGSVTGSVVLSSNATNSAVVINLTGQGLANAHSVTLSWGPSASSVIGYYTYRKSSSDDSWMRVSTSVVAALSYTDFTVQAGQRYFYAVSAVGIDGQEGSLSDPVSVVVPS
jgi:hypothetical protein